jgi:hypothetical protein
MSFLFVTNGRGAHTGRNVDVIVTIAEQSVAGDEASARLSRVPEASLE